MFHSILLYYMFIYIYNITAMCSKFIFVFHQQKVDRKERRRRARALLDILSECEDKQFTSFCDALITDGQSLIVDNYLRRDITDDQRRRRQMRKRRHDQGNVADLHSNTFIVVIKYTVSLVICDVHEYF